MWQDYQVANDVFKTTKTMTLWKAENGLVEVAQSTLAVPIKSSEKIRGYLFHGQGKLLLDAIVETRNGAIGKSIEKELNKPFLTVENAEQI